MTAADKTAAAMLATIKHRIGDYDAGKVIAERDRLIAMWRAAHPEAAAEPPSEKPRPFVRYQVGEIDNQNRPELWTNDIYNLSVRRWSEDAVFGTRGGMIQVGIHALDGTARHDWREFQQIKNQIAGEECEAFELYPAESRVLDPSNYYTLWCFPGLRRLKVGVADEGRRVLNAGEALAPQRAFTE